MKRPEAGSSAASRAGSDDPARRRARPQGDSSCEMKRPSRGKILAVKWGLNPNSSSLGVDVTFLLFGATLVSLLTPMVGALVRWRRTPRTP